MPATQVASDKLSVTSAAPFGRFILALATLLTLAACVCPSTGSAQQKDAQTQLIEDIGVDQRVGQHVPADLSFLNEQGEPVTLGDYLGKTPVILTPVYYECPMLCGLVLNSLLKTLNSMKFTAGKEFSIVTFTFAPDETPELAGQKQANYLKSYNRPDADGWHFLSAPGDEASIRRLTDALGFRYRLDEASGEYAHPAALVILTPQGTISRYITGLEYSPKELRLALVEASEERIGSVIDQLFLLCFHYDPSTGKYTLAVKNLLRLGGLMTVGAMALFVGLSLKDERRRPDGKGAA